MYASKVRTANRGGPSWLFTFCGGKVKNDNFNNSPGQGLGAARCYFLRQDACADSIISNISMCMPL